MPLVVPLKDAAEAAIEKLRNEMNPKIEKPELIKQMEDTAIKDSAEVEKENDEDKPATPNMSDELKKMLDEMYKSYTPHEDVYPPTPKKGDIVIPLGCLAKCICSPDCTKELPVPAYRILGDSEEDERWCTDVITEQEIYEVQIAGMIMTARAQERQKTHKTAQKKVDH
ncbi:hypothetical protein GCK72_020135 [Caenorhabditis remanei]|uniref:Uncharacterized protein n=1 Tax=Caenorhabditis remanei TaxID=31234 RepID=A0A6A5GEI6_CAERE|nr:hypothetical protein GCK72_020135 [Caenorhabditis remanei]KAF1753578.1 hypothetical protein GCK72_020135 [Caenorhabditis remanei]